MLWYKSYREIRVVTLVGILGMAAACVLIVLNQQTMRAHADTEMTYIAYIWKSVYNSIGRDIFVILCIILGSGSLLQERVHGTSGFTLALPVSRASLVASRASLGFVQVLILAAIPSLIVTVVARAVGQELPLDYALRFIPLWAAGGIFTFAISFIASVLLSSEYVSLAVAYLTYIFYLAAVRHPTFGRFHLHVADFMSGLFPHYLDRSTMLWTSTYAINPIVCFFAAALLLIAVSGLVTSRQDL